MTSTNGRGDGGTSSRPVDVGGLRLLVDELNKAGGCVHPVRLHGTSLDVSTGEWWEGTVGIACKDRRAAICPTCATRYRMDAWHIIAAGLRGGKGVPESVAAHPAVFATLTAPTFGPVHAARSGPCRPRRSTPRCLHGVVLSCTRHHGESDPVLGEPLCASCFDYEGAIIWNAHVGALWDRTAALVRSELAEAIGATARTSRNLLRLSYVKVAEFQQRGLVHLHAVVRADGPTGPDMPPPPELSGEIVEAAIRAAARRASVDGPNGTVMVWGRELDTASLDRDCARESTHPGAVASYLAGYAVKSSEGSGVLARRLNSLQSLDRRRPRRHVVKLVETAWSLGADPELEELRLRDNAHTFGYRGHFLTASRTYSTTFSALRAARVAYGRPPGEVRLGSWQFTGRGYKTPKAAELAEVFASLPRARRPRP